MNTKDNGINTGTFTSALAGAKIAGGIATIGTGAGIVAAPPIGAPLAIVIGAGYLVSEAWDWLFD